MEGCSESSLVRFYTRLVLLSIDGARADRTGIRRKEGDVAERDGSLLFPPVGKRGAFIMEFPDRTIFQPGFSLVVNDQPVISGINLRKTTFQSF